MSKTLNIDIPDGYIIDEEKSSFEKIVFKKIQNVEFPQWEKLGLIGGYSPNSEASTTYRLNSALYPYSKILFATKEQAEASIALAQLSQLMKHVNDGWEPDWHNEDQFKYCIGYFGEKAWVSDLRLAKDARFIARYFLTFPTEAKAYGFLKAYRDLIEKAKPLL